MASAIWIIIVVVIALLLIAGVVVGLVFWLRRNKGKESPPSEPTPGGDGNGDDGLDLTKGCLNIAKRSCDKSLPDWALVVNDDGIVRTQDTGANANWHIVNGRFQNKKNKQYLAYDGTNFSLTSSKDDAIEGELINDNTVNNIYKMYRLDDSMYIMAKHLTANLHRIDAFMPSCIDTVLKGEGTMVTSVLDTDDEGTDWIVQTGNKPNYIKNKKSNFGLLFMEDGSLKLQDGTGSPYERKGPLLIHNGTLMLTPDGKLTRLCSNK